MQMKKMWRRSKLINPFIQEKYRILELQKKKKEEYLESMQKKLNWLKIID